MRSRLRIAGVVLLAGLAACGGETPPSGPTIYGGGPAPDGLRSEVAREALTRTDGEPLIDPAELRDAAGYDGIPSIDAPVAISRTKADEELTATEQVMLVRHEGQSRAYPVRSLIQHEIVNDEIAGLPVAVTWCPLCNTGIVFDRRVGGRAEVFGVSGALYRSALVMFDRRTQSLWPQPLGTAVLGPQLGAELTVLASSLLPWQQVRDAHPDVRVVLESEDELDETDNPYDGYDVSGNPFLFDGETDDRLAPFVRVVGVTFGGTSRAWSYDLLRRDRTVDAKVGDQPLVVLWAPGSSSPLETGDVRQGRDVGSSGVYDPRLDGRTLAFTAAGPTEFRDRETGSRWTLAGQATDGPLKGRSLTPLPHQDAFWFAWAAFQPDTELRR
jgi:hypothetical protein